MEILNEDLLINMMIDMPYEDLVSFKGTSREIRKLHDDNEDYIYKSRIFANDCVKSYEDVYLLASGKRDNTFLCIKNKMYLPKKTDTCEKFENYPPPSTQYMSKQPDADRQFYQILKYLYRARECFNNDPNNAWFQDYDNVSSLSSMFFIASSVGTVSSVIYEQVWYEELENLKDFQGKISLLEAELQHEYSP